MTEILFRLKAGATCMEKRFRLNPRPRFTVGHSPTYFNIKVIHWHISGRTTIIRLFISVAWGAQTNKTLRHQSKAQQ